MKKKIFAIIDGNAIIHRGYHALPPMTTKDGTMVNAVYGFTSMLLKVMNELKPEYLAVSFDVAGKTFRDKIYEDYKATRVKADQELYDQIPLVYDVVAAFNIPIFTKKGFEADDIIGTLVEKVESKKEKVESVVVTGDMDMLQLVNENTKVYALRKGFSDIVMYDMEKVKERYGFGPERVVDYKALKGDTSDNIPGVSGIGDKTAKELIEKVGGIEEIYATIDDQQSTIRKEFKEGVIKKLEAGKKDAKMSEKLATIDRDVRGLNFKLEDCVMRDFDIVAVSDLLRKLEFFSLLKRVPGSTDYGQQTTVNRDKKATGKKLTIVTEENFDEFLKEMKDTKEFACKEVLSGKDVLTSKLEGLVFVVREKGFYVKEVKISALGGESRKEKVLELFSDDKIILVGHDLKQLIKALRVLGMEVKNKLFDVMIASYLLNSSTRSHDLKEIVMRELGKDVPRGADQGSLFGMDPKIMAQELDLLFEVKNKFAKELKSEADIGLFEKMEMKLIPVLAEMELNGVSVDTKILSELSQDANKTIKELTKKIWKEAGQEFNIASSVQLREVLFEKMELPTQNIKKGKTGYSTAQSELEKLRQEHEIIPLIEEYREVEKLRNTYIDVLPNLINEKTGRIHTSFNQAVTTTGRLSSSDPNLQNIPIRTDLGRKVRETFVAEKGYALVVADYSQIELRIVASMAKDKKLMEIFEKGEDVHKATAAVINGVPLDKVTKEMRSAAKAVNFGVLYGMGAFGLASRTGIARFEAQDFIKKYFEKFSGVKKYLDKTLEFAKDEGYVETLFGRRRYIPELNSDNYQLKSSGERMAINMPIQGTAADIMKLAMIEVRNKIQETRHKKDDVKMILQVHDELVLEVKNELEDEIAKLVKEEMEKVVKLNVPVEVHVGVGHSWGKIK